MNASVKIEGLDLVRRNLRNVQSDLPRGLTRIHSQIAEPVADRAKRKVRSRTGRLARTIRPSATQALYDVTAGRGLLYGVINHYGGYPGNYRGNPYLTDAFKEETPESVRQYDRQLGKFIDSVWVDNR